MLDLETLLAPISEDAPAGPDLEYDPGMQELERLAQGKPEQQFGDTVIPAEEPSWREIHQQALALLTRTKDVRVACLLARSGVRLDHFGGLSECLSFMHQLMERYWDTVHPQLDAEDDNDPTMRLNSLAALSDPQGLLGDVRETFLFRSRQHGELTVRQLEVVAGKATARQGDPELSPAHLDQQLLGVLGEDPELAPRTRVALDAARSLSQFLDNAVGSGRAPDLKPLIATLTVVEQFVARAAAALAGAQASEASEQEAGEIGVSVGGSAGGAGVVVPAGAIRTRTDVIVQLDRLCEFLQRTEPTNPAPLLLQRAKRLMQMNFLELIDDLAPDGASQVRIVVGADPSEAATEEY